jgi:hypothetical protein
MTKKQEGQKKCQPSPHPGLRSLYLIDGHRVDVNKCKEEWEKNSVSRCAKLIETYPKRLTAVIAAKGGATKY